MCFPTPTDGAQAQHLREAIAELADVLLEPRIRTLCNNAGDMDVSLNMQFCPGRNGANANVAARGNCHPWLVGSFVPNVKLVVKKALRRADEPAAVRRSHKDPRPGVGPARGF